MTMHWTRLLTMSCLAVAAACKRGEAAANDAGAASTVAATKASAILTAEGGAPAKSTAPSERIRFLRAQKVSDKCPAGMAYVLGGKFMMGSLGNEWTSPESVDGRSMQPASLP